MAKKIRRNDPCPCGSGKKYKHCCMRAEQSKESTTSESRSLLQSSGLDAPKIKAYLGIHYVEPLLDYLIALQLNPSNHGKNLRLEHISQLIVSSIGRGSQRPDLKTFKQLIDEEYPYDVMEDIPTNMYFETVLFHGGNHILFPGLSTHCSELFRAMTESIYRDVSIFSDSFKDEIYQGVTLMLELGTAIARRAGLTKIRMERGNDHPREIISEPLISQSYAMTREMLTYLFKVKGIDESVLDSFLLKKNETDILTSDADRNPILYRPIVELEGNYYFLGILNQGCAINNYILKTAVKYNCIGELVRMTHDTVWNRIGMSCINIMHWGAMKFDGFLNEDKHYKECLFRIDINWVVYLCYASDTENDVSIDGTGSGVCWNIDDRLKKTLVSIKSNDKTKGFHVLNLVLYTSMGESFALMMNNQPNSDYLLQFSAFDFLQLIQTEKWDSMSLVRYARTKEFTPSLLYGINQPLDCYSLYKRKGESYYMSDKAKPDMLQIEPNEGCELIHESKKKLDFHGTPIRIDDRRIAYIPVQRDMNYAAIYKPLDTLLKAKCCESFSVPIWVRCPQDEVEGENPSSITDTVITAIAYWVDRLRPAICDKVAASYKGPIEIDLEFPDDTLSEKYMHYDLTKPFGIGNGMMTVSKKETGVEVSFDNDYLRGFMGASNAQERDMMKGIISVMLTINKEYIQNILDELMPLGPAKMILMLEASNNPISNPFWLNPPIYIHEASSQLLLDFFPKWMEKRGYDIKEKLSNIAQKDEFLHHGVDVLLERIYSLTDKFDSHTLLIHLVSNYETLLFQREHDKMIFPAQILCFGDNEDKRKEIFDTDRRLTEAGIATRAMIEYVSATQGENGKEQAGVDDIEWLMTIMSEVIHVGGICDAIHLGVSDHTIEKLDSGRYGIYDDDFNDSVFSFASARTEETVNNQVDDYEQTMENLANLKPQKGGKRDAVFDEIDDAFKSDWGVSYTAIFQVLYSCYKLAMKKNHSVVEIDEKEFETSLIKICSELSEDSIKKALVHLALEKRGAYLTAPEGMDSKEIFPWIYNRELSYLRRPIIRWLRTDGGVNIVYGVRSCLLAGIQLSDLLHSGRLKFVGKKLGKLLGKFESEKGRAFNEVVRDWLRQNTTLRVWSHDVSIKPKGNLVATEDLGDIDVLAYDSVKNVVYLIECKNTNTAKNVREMKKEMDDYLGRGDNPEKDKKKALVLKHLRRHKWVNDNINQVQVFVGATDKPVIKSMMLTSEVIPTSYLRKEETPLSILNFQELKRKGVVYLDNVKDV